MKRKGIIVFVLLVISICLIGVGVWLKNRDRYLFETYDDIKEVVAKQVDRDQESLEILNERHYKTDDFHLYMIALKDQENYYFYIYEEQNNKRYKEYYHCRFNDQNKLREIRDYQKDILIVHFPNQNLQVSELKVTSGLNDSRTSLHDEKYVIECFNKTSTTGIPKDTSGDFMENYITQQEEINQRR